jgi:hypothetical protein
LLDPYYSSLQAETIIFCFAGHLVLRLAVVGLDISWIQLWGWGFDNDPSTTTGLYPTEIFNINNVYYIHNYQKMLSIYQP